jgi:hypothetical protein
VWKYHSTDYFNKEWLVRDGALNFALSHMHLPLTSPPQVHVKKCVEKSITKSVTCKIVAVRIEK